LVGLSSSLMLIVLAGISLVSLFMLFKTRNIPISKADQKVSGGGLGSDFTCMRICLLCACYPILYRVLLLFVGVAAGEFACDGSHAL
jgi:hypothetical protein